MRPSASGRGELRDMGQPMAPMLQPKGVQKGSTVNAIRKDGGKRASEVEGCPSPGGCSLYSPPRSHGCPIRVGEDARPNNIVTASAVDSSAVTDGIDVSCSANRRKFPTIAQYFHDQKQASQKTP